MDHEKVIREGKSEDCAFSAFFISVDLFLQLHHHGGGRRLGRHPERGYCYAYLSHLISVAGYSHQQFFNAVTFSHSLDIISNLPECHPTDLHHR